jgi:hypothetical protein
MSAATGSTPTTAAMSTAAFIGSVGRGRQRSSENKDDNPKLEIQHDVPL